eukprot:scaffold3785_cov101-Skeletonema_dohrnii-CCMP3373.AAC.7
MKQAYTNTIRGGGGRPLTIATGSKKARKSNSNVPKCAYGSACNRKGCAFRHDKPTNATQQYESYHDDPKSKICKQFLGGICSYGNKCLNRHPGEEEAERVRAQYKKHNCTYGDDCMTEGCLYFHPWEVEEVESNNPELLCQEVNGLTINGSSMIPTYEQWIATNCPAPATMDEAESYKIWYYPGSGMQRQPYEVYTLMYPQQTTSSLNATSQLWQPATNNIVSQPAPQSFQEWKQKGCPYPDWFTSDHDPWYDDDNRRREMEEVYELLYGEGAEETFALQQEVQNEAFPTPAELLANSNDISSSSQTIPAEAPTSGWASIAAKRPPQSVERTMTATVDRNATATYQQNTNSAKTKRPVAIPKEVWLPDTANSAYFHISNPIERFNAVNDFHKAHLSTVKIPLCFESNGTKNSRGGKVALLDVHFQSAKTITPVLNRFLAKALSANSEVWIVTGSGQHVGVGHQRREGGGVLFNAVKRYLEEHEDDRGFEFRIGKDTSGGKNKVSGGAFLVRKI